MGLELFMNLEIPYQRRLHKVLFVVLCALTSGSPKAANAVVCNKSQVSVFKVDTHRQSNPLKRVDGGYLGFEYFRVKPLFENAQIVREFINNHTEHGPFKGSVTIQVDHRDAFTSEPNGAPIDLLTVQNEIKNSLPLEIAKPLMNYIESVFADANRREHTFYSFQMHLRTERFDHFVNAGHNHGHAGDLVYSRDEIGPNLQHDKLNRFEPIDIKESDYTVGSDPNLLVVIGDVWHRSPPLRPGEQRLNILIDLH